MLFTLSKCKKNPIKLVQVIANFVSIVKKLTPKEQYEENNMNFPRNFLQEKWPISV